jgi:hypothetical protein
MQLTKYPPNYREITKAFPKVVSTSCLFAWGDDYYNPYNVRVPIKLEAHEAMHGRRQLLYASKIYGDGIEGWWAQYLKDPGFRLDEEVIAHRMEYLTANVSETLNRHERRGLLKVTAARLAHPMYEYGITKARALRLLRENPS